MITKKHDKLYKAANEYANSIAQHDERKTYCVEDFIAGAEWQKEQFEKNRLTHCDNITEQQYNLETGFISQHLEKYNRMPTFLDAIEYGMKKVTDKACEWLKENKDHPLIGCEDPCLSGYLTDEFIEHFKKTMEE